MPQPQRKHPNIGHAFWCKKVGFVFLANNEKDKATECARAYKTLLWMVSLNSAIHQTRDA